MYSAELFFFLNTLLSGMSTKLNLLKGKHTPPREVTIFISLLIGATLKEIISLRKHAYSNTLKFLLPKKTKNLQIKISGIFQISAQNIDCGYSLEPPR